jgi:hypothetical protein
VSPAHLPYGKRASSFRQAWTGGRHPTLVELQWQPLPMRRSSIRLQLTRLNRRHAHGLHHGRGHGCRRRQEGIASIVEYSFLSHTSNMAEGDRYHLWTFQKPTASVSHSCVQISRCAGFRTTCRRAQRRSRAKVPMPSGHVHFPSC